MPFIRGNRCLACGGENDGIFDICPKCLKENSRPWTNAVATMNYKNEFMTLIKTFKYNNRTHLARLFGEITAEVWKKEGLNADCVSPIPLHWTRSLSRGYNQAELVASVFSKKTGIPMIKTLKRVKFTPKQARLSREERKKNLSNAFQINKKTCAFQKFGTILLLDDVLTTGVTLETATRTLLNSGVCDEVNIIVLARG